MKTSKKYNWDKIQQAYNDGLSQRGLIKKFGMSSRTLTTAVRNGNLVCRSKSEAANLYYLYNEPPKHTEEFKVKQRERILARYETGWMPKAGRCKKYKYISPIAGEVYLDGTWELAVAKWLDFNNYHWNRNTKRFSYINLKGKPSHYIPDFWVNEMNTFVEVKGYETKLDRCKWSQFNEPLVIWKKKELIEMNII